MNQHIENKVTPDIEARKVAVLGALINSGVIEVNESLFLIMDEIEKSMKHGGVFHLVIPLCPDYSYVTGPDGRPRFTFESVGGDIGLVGKGILQTVLPVMQTLAEQRIHAHVMFMYADHEADDPEVCAAMGIDLGDFHLKVEKSRRSMAEAVYLATHRFGMPHHVSFDVLFMRDIGFNDPVIITEAQKLMQTLKQSSIAGLAIERADLLRTWFQNHPQLKNAGISAFNDFIINRTALNICEHLQLTLAVRDYQGGGFLRSGLGFLTMDALSFIRFYNFGMDTHVPVLRVLSGYS